LKADMIEGPQPFCFSSASATNPSIGAGFKCVLFAPPNTCVVVARDVSVENTHKYILPSAHHLDQQVPI
jgi:hypothetical protein